MRQKCRITKWFFGNGLVGAGDEVNSPLKAEPETVAWVAPASGGREAIFRCSMLDVQRSMFFKV